MRPLRWYNRQRHRPIEQKINVSIFGHSFVKGLCNQLNRDIAKHPQDYEGLSHPQKYARAMWMDERVDELLLEWSPTIYDEKLDENMLDAAKSKPHLAIYHYGSNEIAHGEYIPENGHASVIVVLALKFESK